MTVEAYNPGFEEYDVDDVRADVKVTFGDVWSSRSDPGGYHVSYAEDSQFNEIIPRSYSNHMYSRVAHSRRRRVRTTPNQLSPSPLKTKHPTL